MIKKNLFYALAVLVLVVLAPLMSSAELGDPCASKDDCYQTYLTDHGKFYGYCDGVCRVADGMNGNMDFSDWCDQYGKDYGQWPKDVMCAQMEFATTDTSNGDFKAKYDYRHNRLEVWDESNTIIRKYYYDSFGSGMPYASWTRESGVTQSAIDPAGKVMWSIDANKNKMVNLYDELERLTRVRYSNSNGTVDYWTDYCYDTYCGSDQNCNSEGKSSFNLLCEVRESNGKTKFVYDIKGRVKQRTTTIYNDYQGARKYVFSYTYNDDDSLDTVILPNGETISYDYNLLGQLISITHNGKKLVNLKYNAFGSVTEKELNPEGKEIFGSFEYDNKSQLVSLYYSFDSPYNNGDNLLSRGMKYDKMGNVMAISYSVNPSDPAAFQSVKEGYSYDKLYRLTSANYTDPEINTFFDFTYENLLGDRLTKTINGARTTYNYEDGRLTDTTDSESFSYDENGNVVSYFKPQESGQYIYDSLNRMTESIVSGQKSFYTYDSANQRVVKRSSEGTKFYVYDAGKVVMEESIAAGECARACGDLNGDENIDEDDLNMLINFVWGSGESPAICASNVDGSSDNEVNYNDVVYMAKVVYQNYNPMCTPDSHLGENPTLGKTLEDLRLAIENN